MNFFKQLFAKKDSTPPIHSNRICPYCFYEIEEDNYHFRETNGNLVDDSQLTKFMREIHNNPSREPEKRLAVVAVKANTENRPNVKLVKRKDGSPWKIILTDENRELEQVLCPNCHNDLPRGFGSKPLKIIALYGNTSSGKTVYLTQLLGDAFAGIQDEYNAGFFPFDTNDARVRDNKKILENIALDATPPNAYVKPFIQEICFNTIREEVIFSIFDVPGESHGSSEYMRSIKARQFKYCDAIMVFLHPDDTSIVGKDGSPQGIQDNFVITQSFKNYIQNYTEGRKVAIVLGKSDRLMTHPDLANSILFEDFSRLHTNEVNEVDRIVSSFVEKHQNSVYRNLESLLQDADYKFFAVSSLGENPEANNSIDHVLQPLRVAEPFLWLLSECGVKSLKGE